jgi:hypothetical protein
MRPLPIGFSHEQGLRQAEARLRQEQGCQKPDQDPGTVAVVATTVAVLQNSGIRNLNKFLEEKGLADEYYHMDELDEN